MPTGNESNNVNQSEVIDSRCIVEFRPVDDWNGEYGFDWFRRGDAGEYFNKKRHKCNYITLVGKYITKVNYDAILNSSVQQSDFKRFAEYDKNNDEGIESSQNDCLYELCKEYPHRVIKGIDRLYYIPTLSLFYKNSKVNKEQWGDTNAIVKLLIDAKNIRRIEFICDDGIRVETETIQYENKILEIDSSLPDGTEYICDNPKKYIDIESDKKELYLDISSTVESIDTEKSIKTIKVFAKTDEEVRNNDVGTFSGQLNILHSKIKEVDICIVHVRILDNRQQVSIPKMKDIERERRRIKKFLSQAQILPHFMKDQIIDLEKSQIQDYFSHTTDTGDQVMLVFPFSTIDDLYQILLQQFDRLLVNLDDKTKQEYNKSCKLFFINEWGSLDDGDPRKTISKGLLGLANPNGSNEALVFKNSDPKTVSHELFHCLGLEHSFENSNKHTFKAKETSNIMDYSPNSFSLWQWQWNDLRKNQKDFSINNYKVTNIC